LYDRPLAEKEPVHGRAARVARLDDEVINRAYKEGVRQFSALVKSKPDWPEIVLLPYDEPTERLMPEAALRYKQIKEVAPELRVYGVTMNRLRWAEQVAPISDILVCNGDFREIAAEYRELLDGLPPDRGPSAFPPDADGAYPDLPSYHKLTEVRERIAAWIEQLRPDR